ncbi:MAG: mechanosensitive ion channel, partial [Alistipes sp.]
IANINVKELLSSLISDAVVLVLQILLALTIYAIGRWIIRRIVKLLDATFERREVDASLRSFMRHTIKMILTIMLILSVIQTLGVNVTSIIALFASATLAIGMALSGTAQNFAGGVMVLLMKPYRVGDFISAQGQSGEVKEIKLFSTVIQTADHQTIYIPNNSIATAIIDNYSTSEFRRVDWTIGMAYGNDVEVARETILGLLLADERILKDHDTVVWVASLGDSSVNLTVRAWVMNGDYWSVFFEYNEKFYKILPTKGIEFPFPQMDIHLKKEA